ncbi:SGNH/GDSL hydrolase family protein [Acinetobacter sp.]|uniref:SGNH/GDSL hydrolase family protein n=1 Tax=Acinetobacter sp. TaxID=472 RepID=UPI002FC81CDA
MQTSNNNYPDLVSPPDGFEQQEPEAAATQDTHLRGICFVLAVLLSFGMLGIWIMQNSVNAYFQQTYHRESPLMQLGDYSLWAKGGSIGDVLYASHGVAKAAIEEQNGQLVNGFNADYAFTPEFKAELARKIRLEEIRLAQEKAAIAEKALLDQFTLTKADEIFFAGDSLMQGVAPHVQKHLQQGYQIKSVNLSKQSTGLSYPGFFDWPKTIKETLASNRSIKILAVFLGPNDPWDMPNPQGGSYLKFKSPQWEAVYRSRIADIIQAAQRQHVSVMWLSPPNMGKPMLNEQMIYLNQVIADEVKKNKAFFIDTRPLLGGKNDVYSDYLVKNNQSIKMRSADGIHFSPDGQKIIAQEIEKHLKIVN